MKTNQLPLELADDTSGGALSVDTKVMEALVAHQVVAETASLMAEKDTLLAEVATLKDQLEVAQKAHAAAVQEFVDFKESLAAAEAAKRIGEERAALVKAAAPTLEPTPERLAKWASASQEDFDSYLADIASVITVKPNGEVEAFSSENAETAAARNKPVTPTAESAARATLGLI